MSTHAIIAAPLPTDPDRWRGIYVHAEGQPTGAGKELYAQVVTHFRGDLEEAAAHYIDAHPAGWSYLGEGVGANECYCHDRGEGTGDTFFRDESDARAHDWSYVLRAEGLEIHRWNRGMVGFVRWDTERTDWEVLEEAAQIRAS